MLARSGLLADIGRGVTANGGKGIGSFSTGDLVAAGSSTSSSRGVEGSELSIVDVESSESCGFRDDGRVGLGNSLRPRVPTCWGRPVMVEVDELGVWLGRCGKPSVG